MRKFIFILALALLALPCSAQMTYKVGTITPADGTGTEAFTGVGFQPELIRFWSVANDVGITEHISYAEGWTDCTNRFSVSMAGLTDEPGTTSDAVSRTTPTHVLEILGGQ